MRRWKFCSIVALALGFGALGCSGGGASSKVSLTISPTTASVITNTTQPFTPFVTGTTDMVVDVDRDLSYGRDRPSLRHH